MGDTHDMERRRARRLDKAFPVFLSGNRGVCFGIARNISEGGMFVETDDADPLGSRVLVTFAWPGGGAELSCEAEVRFTTVERYGEGMGERAMQGMGLKFLRFLPRDEYEAPPADPSALH